ncbi:MAG TPA: cation:dicarboxylase symporter family transporter, partial [Methylomirabilota bacterium]|nr:cation:dicarboxylase symporter family transporter [Methylomirabilota bacterium]
MSWYRKLHWQILLGLVLGLLFGIIAAGAGWSEFTSDWIAPFGTVFLNLLKLIAVPLVLTSLITGVASLSDMRQLTRMGGKTLALYLATTTVAVTMGLVLVNLFQPGHRVPEAMRAELQATYASEVTGKTELAEITRERGPLQPLVDVVPDNFLDSASSNQNMLQVVFLALFVGIALAQVSREKAAPVLAVFQGLTEVVIRMVHLIMYTAPIGVFALMSDTITTLAGDSPGRIASLFGALGYYCGVVVLGLLLQTVLVYGGLLR